MVLPPPRPPLFPYTTLFRSIALLDRANGLLFTGDTYYPAPIWLFRPETDLDAYVNSAKRLAALAPELKLVLDRKSTRLNSSHRCISYAVFCLKKKNSANTTL